MERKGEEKAFFSNQHRPEYHLRSARKILESAADKHDSVVALPFWSSKGERMYLHVYQQPSRPKAWKDVSWKSLSGFSGVSHLCPVSPHPLLSTCWATVPQALLSVEPQIPPHTTCTQNISSPHLRPCLHTSLNPPLKSCPKPSPYVSFKPCPRTTFSPRSQRMGKKIMY